VGLDFPKAAFDMDLTADRRSVAEVYLGCKGIVSFVLSCSGGGWGGPVGRALHSSEGVVISSSAWSLVRALSAVQDAAGDGGGCPNRITPCFAWRPFSIGRCFLEGSRSLRALRST
jgi:hypothetical protein